VKLEILYVLNARFSLINVEIEIATLSGSWRFQALSGFFAMTRVHREADRF
jgi:hypothetical protein